MVGQRKTTRNHDDKKDPKSITSQIGISRQELITHISEALVSITKCPTHFSLRYLPLQEPLSSRVYTNKIITICGLYKPNTYFDFIINHEMHHVQELSTVQLLFRDWNVKCRQVRNLFILYTVLALMSLANELALFIGILNVGFVMGLYLTFVIGSGHWKCYSKRFFVYCVSNNKKKRWQRLGRRLQQWWNRMLTGNLYKWSWSSIDYFYYQVMFLVIASLNLIVLVVSIRRKTTSSQVVNSPLTFSFTSLQYIWIFIYFYYIISGLIYLTTRLEMEIAAHRYAVDQLVIKKQIQCLKDYFKLWKSCSDSASCLDLLLNYFWGGHCAYYEQYRIKKYCRDKHNLVL